MLKYLLLSLASLLAFNFCALAQSSQVKFGYFNSGDFIQSMPEIEQMNKTLNDEASKVESQVVALRQDFEKQVADYQKSAQNLSAEQRSAKEAELSEVNQRIQTFIETSRTELQKKQQELVAPILQKVRKAVEQVGANNGFLYIFEQDAALFNGAKCVDVTPLVKKELGIN